jgi:hypothetical protein
MHKYELCASYLARWHHLWILCVQCKYEACFLDLALLDKMELCVSNLKSYYFIFMQKMDVCQKKIVIDLLQNLKTMTSCFHCTCCDDLIHI